MQTSHVAWWLPQFPQDHQEDIQHSFTRRHSAGSGQGVCSSAIWDQETARKTMDQAALRRLLFTPQQSANSALDGWE